MKRILSGICAAALMLSLSACGSKTEDTVNTLSRATLTPREQMLAGNQDVFIYDVETDANYQTVSIYIEAYENGEKLEDIANLQCALPQADKKKDTKAGSIAILLRSDNRFYVAVCDETGDAISANASDAVQPIADATYTQTTNLVSVDAPQKITENQQTLAYLVYGDESKTQGSFDASVFLDPVAHVEQAQAFDRIYLIKCKFS